MQHNPNYRQSGVVDAIKERWLDTDKFAICNLIKNYNYALPKTKQVKDAPISRKELSVVELPKKEMILPVESVESHAAVSLQQSIEVDESKHHFFVAIEPKSR